MQTTKLPGKKTSRLLLVFFGIILLVALVALSLPVSAGTSQPVIISAHIVSKPSADFSADPTDGVAPLLVQFSDLSTGSPNAWNWSFGDGSFSEDPNPQHPFAAGIYTIRLNASNSAGFNIKTKQDFIRSYHSENDLVLDTPGLYSTGSNILFVKAEFSGHGSYEVRGNDLIITYPQGSQFKSLTIHFTRLDDTQSQITGIFTSIVLEGWPIEGSKYQFTIYLNSIPNPWPAEIATVNTLEDADSTTRDKFEAYASAHGLILLNTSYVLFVTPHINPSYIKSVDLKLWVNRSWTDIDGIGSVKVMRIDSADLTTSLLFTQYNGIDGANYTFVATSPHGFSTFGITAVRSSSPPPPPPPAGNGGGGGIEGGSDGSTSGNGPSTDQGPAAAAPAAAPAEAPAAAIAAAPAPAAAPAVEGLQGVTVNQGYPVGFDGMSFNASGDGTLIIDTLSARQAGAMVTEYSDRITIYQHGSPGVLITFYGEQIRRLNSTITGKVSSAEFVTEPLLVNVPSGIVSGSIHAVLTAITQRVTIDNSISGDFSAETIEQFRDIMAQHNLPYGGTAFTLKVKKADTLKTGAADVTLTVPAYWVTENGGVDAIRIARISDTGATTELISTTYLGLDNQKNMIFRGDSPNGLSIFGMVSAKASAIKQQEEPGVTIQPITKPAMFTDIGMFSWLLAILTANPIILVIIIAFIALALYFGALRYRI
jgi:PKD repeat protein